MQAAMVADILFHLRLNENHKVNRFLPLVVDYCSKHNSQILRPVTIIASKLKSMNVVANLFDLNNNRVAVHFIVFYVFNVELSFDLLQIMKATCMHLFPSNKCLHYTFLNTRILAKFSSI